MDGHGEWGIGQGASIGKRSNLKLTGCVRSGSRRWVLTEKRGMLMSLAIDGASRHNMKLTSGPPVKASSRWWRSSDWRRAR